MPEVELKKNIDLAFKSFAEDYLEAKKTSPKFPELEANLSRFLVESTAAQADILKYFLILQEKNKYLNLTAKASAYDLAVIHLLDSLMLLKAWPGDWPKPGQSFLDLGTGAGLPGLIYKILFPELRVVLVDSLQKRLRFIEEVATELNLSNLELVHGRFEDLAHQPEYRGAFSVVTARAVAALPTLLEYAAGFLEPQAYFLAMKGKQADAELKEAARAIKSLNLRYLESLNFKLPIANVERSIILFTPLKKLSSKYPRKPAEIKQKPLI
ncbi:MAG: 16S rRNA (guanine(527)-N(7))-methyltransferase RsmG [Eubacteriales bacterium]|nr:16S rRNA (guanine(527)-N(7))-methyltransferase RsmG [Eubacteriales bacterium]